MRPLAAPGPGPGPLGGRARTPAHALPASRLRLPPSSPGGGGGEYYFLILARLGAAQSARGLWPGVGSARISRAPPAWPGPGPWPWARHLGGRAFSPPSFHRRSDFPLLPPGLPGCPAYPVSSAYYSPRFSVSAEPYISLQAQVFKNSQAPGSPESRSCPCLCARISAQVNRSHHTLAS